MISIARSCDGDGQLYASPSTRVANDLDAAPQPACALLDAAKTIAGMHRISVETDTVVTHTQNEATVPILHQDLHGGRPSVPGDVVEDFLIDEEHLAAEV